MVRRQLEALPVNDRRSRLVVLLFRDPHLLEGAQAGQDRAADPDRVLPFRRRDYLDLHRGRRQCRYFLLHPVRDTRIHRGAARQNRIRVQILPNVDVALHDRIIRRFVDPARLHAEETRLEHRFRAPETLVTDRDHLKRAGLI